MPIYEFLCRRCNVIYQFYFKSAASASLPSCPRCGEKGLERVLSSFSTKRGGYSAGSSESDPVPDLAGLDESDPRSVARAIRSMADEMGEDLGPELNEAIGRLEAGEDPEKVERDLDEAGLGEGEGQGSAGPVRDGDLYEG